MPKFIVGARLHDYGKGSPDELFGRVAADGFAAVQLAYKKCVPSVRSYADVTDALVAETVAAEKAHSIQVAVLGTYVELAINDESRLKNAADFKSQLAVCKALGAGCIGTETTSMEKQPAGTTREEAQELLCRSLADILPAAEALGVTVAVEPVTYHSMNSAAATRHILDTMRSPNLKVIFDMSNLVNAENVHDQARIWNDMGELLGEDQSGQIGRQFALGTRHFGRLAVMFGRERAQGAHQVPECGELLAGAGGHAVDLVEMVDAVPERGRMSIGI